MGWPLIAIGLILIITGVRDETEEFNAVLMSDIQGGTNNNFLAFIVAISVLAAIGSVKSFRGFSDAFLGLVFLVLLLSNRGFFAEFQRQIQEP
jgi:hypothetical protein